MQIKSNQQQVGAFKKSDSNSDGDCREIGSRKTGRVNFTSEACSLEEASSRNLKNKMLISNYIRLD